MEEVCSPVGEVSVGSATVGGVLVASAIFESSVSILNCVIRLDTCLKDVLVLGVVELAEVFLIRAPLPGPVPAAIAAIA